MKENFYATPLGKTEKNRCWRFMTKSLSLLSLAVMLLWTTGAYAQFAGYYAPTNWVLTQVPDETGGSLNTDAAPASISITSGNLGFEGSTIYTITIPSTGYVSFDWSYTTSDGANYDYPQYSIDGGAALLLPGYSTTGALSQSATASIMLVGGQTFSLIMYTADGVFGAATTTFSNFLAPPDEPMTCGIPTILTATATATDAGVFSWNTPSPTPDSYDVYYNTTGVAPDGSTTPSYAGVTGNSQSVSGLAPNMTYYFWIRSNCGAEQTIWMGPSSFYLGYCVPTTTFVGDYISNFSTIGAVVNVSTSGGTSVAYTDYTSNVVQHYANSSFDFTTTYVGGTNTVRVWVDWNNDFVFGDDEMEFSQTDNPATVIGNIPIADGTPLGSYRLRIRSQFGFGVLPPACGNVAWGETEDYTLQVIEAPDCIPPTGLSGSMAFEGSSNLSWIASVSNPANGYEWFLVEAGAGPEGTQVASGNTAAGVTTAIATGLVDYTAYDLYVRAVCGDGSESVWVGPFTLPTPCTTTAFGLWPTATFEPTCNGTVNVIVTNAWASEYSNVQVYEDEEYIFGSSVATDIITITNSDASVVFAVGVGSVTWTSTITGVVRFHTHLVGCGSATISRSRTVQCGEPWVNEADVEILYTLGSVPLVFGDNHVVQALITNPAGDTWTKTVTLTIEGANSFTSEYELTLEGFESELISFEPFTAANTGLQTVTVSVEDDNVNNNNSYSVDQLVTENLFGHKEPGAPVVDGGVGIGGGFTGNFVAKFTATSPGEVNEIKVDFEGDGGVSYQYRIYSADGPDGLPNTVLFDSPVMISAPGQAFLPVSPAVPVTGDFYVGLRELGTNFQFAYQDESPLRTGIFYFMTEDGTFPWTDISVSGAPTARLAIEAQLYTESAPNCVLNSIPANDAVVCHLAGTTLSWASGGGAPTGYHLYFGTDEDPAFLADVTGTTYEIEELEENGVYYWYVVPFNEFGDAECSEVLTFTASMDGCYCTPVYTFGTPDGDLISHVQIIGTTLDNNTGTTPGGPSYTYYTGQPNYTGELQAGTSYDVTVTVGAFGSQNVAVWVDYNDDGVFTEDERVGYTIAMIPGNGTATFTIHLDCNAPVGVHRMRVRDVYFVLGAVIDPCASYGFGETEDYDITITEAPACPAPFGGFAQNITDTTATLYWESGCEEEAWDVHVTTAGSGAPTGEPSHPDATSPLEIDGLTQLTAYEFWVMALCDDDNSSSWTGPFLFTTVLPPPANDNPCTAAELPVGSDCVYQTFTTQDATSTTGVDDPTCGFYQGNDVWFAVTVPGNGQVIATVEDQGIGDAAMAAYTGETCDGTLTQIACNDDTNGLMPALNLTGLTPNTTVYLRVWRYGNTSAGMFGICVTTPCGAPISVEVEVVNNSATITWPSMGETASYNWEVRLSGEPGSGDEGLVQDGTTEEGVTSITITDLDYLSVYNFYISTNCDEGVVSPWSSATVITTGLMPGCMNEDACNYNPDAGIDDGSCILELTTFYLDSDGDGYGDATESQEDCEAPEGYVANNTDCDDSDETVWQSNTLYVDVDVDGYDNGSSVMCYGEELPDGYSLTSNGTDCNDNDNTVWEQSILEVSLQLPVTTICHNSAAFTLTGGSPAGGTWSGLGVTGSTFTPSSDLQGANNITYTIAGDGVCVIGGSASATITVTICPGINEDDVDNIQLFPTYTNGSVTVVGTDLKEAIILDLNGKQIGTVSLFNTSVIDMHDYSAGIYFVRVVGDNKVRTFKVIRVN